MNDETASDARDWYSNETATFGDRLADARAAVGLSKAELAERLAGEGEGLPDPSAIETVDAGTVGILAEMRQLQSDIIRCGDRLGHLGKRLRLAQKGA